MRKRTRCARCRKRPRLPGTSYCNHCLLLFRKDRRKRLDAAGLCHVCGTRPKLPHRKRCTECTEYEHELRARRMARKAAWAALQQEAAELLNNKKEKDK